MCNCGKKRSELKQPSRAFNINVQSKAEPVIQKTDTVSFQYTGNTGLTITGSITRKAYRFNFPGDVQPVEISDANSMMAVPVLKRI